MKELSGNVFITFWTLLWVCGMAIAITKGFWLALLAVFPPFAWVIAVHHLLTLSGII